MKRHPRRRAAVPIPVTIHAIRTALEFAGVEFIAKNGWGSRREGEEEQGAISMRNGFFGKAGILAIAGMLLGPMSQAIANDTNSCISGACQTAEKSWHTVKNGTVNAAHDTAQWSEKAGRKSWNTVRDGSVDAAHNTAKWSEKTSGKIGKWGQNTGRKVGHWGSDTAKDTKTFFTGH
ncbi:hypothetical protein [Gluconacetobacter diazotrophicus]|uniref:Uncharacterized protein n=1 Tax=Gluconacetobacter diazotrophicus (strain ATCC 49037 / DSM 5601 / CCUG 37298 / CIP 103539 / LMG 7603 / PAl5) TaxID=272568 RepID=A9HE02_GLUDA|nr:hypothetical protein [Gluconacetobacter diazotrophicus]CAP55167.1 hypothetical protein GDI1224 [Gluconacetobacter diazotrophicus PA1 5]